MFQNDYCDFDPDLVRLAKALAVEVIGQQRITDGDADDILQSLILAGLLALPRFNPHLSQRSTFLYLVIKAKARDIIRHACREKRDRFKELFSLNEVKPVMDAGEVSYDELLSGDNDSTEDDFADGACHELHILRMDLENALHEMPPRLRTLCDLLSFHDPGDARREAGLSKHTYHRLKMRIRQFLKKRGIKS